MERTWRAVKDDLRRVNGGRKLTTAQCVIHVVTFADSRLQGGLLAAQRKVCRIYHADPNIAAEYEAAGKVLNERGARKFKQSVDLMLRRREVMAMSEEGVTEIYTRDGEATSKLYETTETSCSCTFFLNHRIPCRHIIFFRKDRQLSLFNKTLYRPFYHSDRAFDLYDTGDEDEDECAVDPEPRGGLLSPSESEVEDGVLEPEQKFKLAKEKANLLTHLISCQGTPEFLKRMEEFAIILQNARKGISLLSVPNPSLRRSQVQSSTSEVKETPVSETSKVDDCKTEETEPRSEEEGDEFGDLKFESKATMRGRPRKVVKSKSWKRPFNSSSKRKEENKDTGAREDVLTVSDASDSDNVAVEDPGTVIICQAPRFRGQFGSNSVCLNDYGSLAPRTMLTDTAVNFHLMLLLQQHEQLQKGRSQVLIIGTEFGQCLDEWDLGKTKEPPEYVQKWTRGTGLWEKPELRTVLVALCHDFHFYLVAAVLDQVRPKLFLLESLNLGRPPPQLAKIKALLEWHAKDSPKKPRPFSISFPLVPQQVPGSLNCGLHVCEMAERILAAPGDAARKAEEESLAFWFDPPSMAEKRTSLANTIEDMGVEQRKPDGVLYGREEAKPVLLKDPSSTKKEVKIFLSEKIIKLYSGCCNLCKEVRRS